VVFLADAITPRGVPDLQERRREPWHLSGQPREDLSDFRHVRNPLDKVRGSKLLLSLFIFGVRHDRHDDIQGGRAQLPVGVEYRQLRHAHPRGATRRRGEKTGAADRSTGVSGFRRPNLAAPGGGFYQDAEPFRMS
jgi:hypothetical protein